MIRTVRQKRRRRLATAVDGEDTHVETTPLGDYSFHRIDPRFFTGFDWYRGDQSFLIAHPEKALIDTLDIATRKGRRFGSLPELELTGEFRISRARSWIQAISDERIRGRVAAEREA